MLGLKLNHVNKMCHRNRRQLDYCGTCRIGPLDNSIKSNHITPYFRKSLSFLGSGRTSIWRLQMYCRIAFRHRCCRVCTHTAKENQREQCYMLPAMQSNSITKSPWWRHQMETFPAIVAFVWEFTSLRWIPHTKASDVELWFFYLRLNKRLNKQ